MKIPVRRPPLLQRREEAQSSHHLSSFRDLDLVSVQDGVVFVSVGRFNKVLTKELVHVLQGQVFISPKRTSPHPQAPVRVHVAAQC